MFDRELEYSAVLLVVGHFLVGLHCWLSPFGIIYLQEFAEGNSCDKPYLRF